MVQRVSLGNTGISASPIAVGTGTNGWSHSSDQTRKGDRWLVQTLNTALNLGINFWDLADQYGSHPFAAQALEGKQRDGIVILTKTTAKRKAETGRDIDRFLKELGTDYLDVLLLHGLTDGNWPRSHRQAMDVLSQAKEQGKIRAVGISPHSLEALEAAVSEPWIDVILVRLNYRGTRMDGKPGEIIPLIEKAHSQGKGIVAMKVMGCGDLSHDPEKAIRFVRDLPCVDSMTLGFLDEGEMRTAVSLMDPSLSPAQQ